jgi:fatty acid CoA ligase FadD9
VTENGAESSMYERRLAALAREDPQLRALVPDATVEAALATPGLAFDQAVATVLDGYSSRPALGQRDYEVVRDAETGRAVREYRPSFSTIAYAEVRRRVEALASAWRHLDEWRVDPGDFLCVLGFTGTEYTTIDLACVYAQAVTVPLQSTVGGAALNQIFTDTAPSVIAATVSDVVLAAQLVGAQESVRALVVFDYDERADDDREAVAAARTALARSGSQARLVTLAELIVAGEAFDWEPPPPSEQGPDRVAMLMHSSGTTGTPKGAILLERQAQSSFKPASPRLPRVRLCFAPMNHTMGRGTLYGTIAHGGTAYFVTKPDLSTLFEDLRLVRPTDGFFFPRALEMIYRHYQREVARLVGRGESDEDTARAEVLAEMREGFLGGRLCLIKGGSAPTSPEVRHFVVEGLNIEFIERYGSTEAGSITVNDRVRRPHVIDYRLRDVPELGYFTTDRPYPRGELCVKTASVISGYFKRPDATDRLFDEDGFVLTGDIVEERGPDHLVYVDRRHDVLKLAQGEFVAAGALAETFENGSEVIHQFYVYGNSSRAYLLAVVVPNLDLLRTKLGHEPDEVELRTLIRAEIKRVAGDARLKAFEIPRDFVVETEPFSQENGLLTALRKRIRSALQRKYGDRLEQRYTDIEREQAAQLAALRSDAGESSVIGRIGKALEAALGLDDVDVDVEEAYSFAELGGDSLGAAEFSVLLEDVFGVEVPVHAILSPTGSPKQWAQMVESALSEGSRRMPTFAQVHGKGARRVDAADLDLAAFLDAGVLDAAPTTPPPGVSRTVLLTGATGFLGRFLCLELLEVVADRGGKLICLVRAADHASAVRRLDSVFDSGDERLEQRYRALAEDHLEVVAGDVAEPALGLGDAYYARLASEVDRIVHSAALVNHVLGYEYVFGSNVAGTAALIGFALAGQQKAFDFVSSGAVSGLLDRSERNDEDSPLLERVTLSREYANGYSTSKWAAEHLLRAAGRRFGLPVNVFRGDMMLPHRRFRDQINVGDMFTRLLYSVITTGIAPASFYLPASDGSRAKAHYDGLPVDFIAAAMVGIGAEPHEGVQTYNVVNDRTDDGVSLDVFVDWTAEAGYPIARLADYHEWLVRFETQLRALPEEKRQLSSLALLDSLRKPAWADKRIAGNRRFADAIRTLPIGPETPPLTQDYLNKCLDDMRRLGLVPAPDRSERRPPVAAGRA